VLQRAWLALRRSGAARVESLATPLADVAGRPNAAGPIGKQG